MVAVGGPSALNIFDGDVILGSTSINTSGNNSSMPVTGEYVHVLDF